MDGRDFLAAAVEATGLSTNTYIKFLSANDTGMTGGHQSGILIGKGACPMIFGSLPTEHVAKRENIRVTWQDDVLTDSTFTWYESKGELRLTRLGRGFPYLKPVETGSLLVFSRLGEDEYSAYILESEDEIEGYLAAFGLGPQDANLMFSPAAGIAPASEEAAEIASYVEALGVGDGAEFPLSTEISAKAREIQRLVHDRDDLLRKDPDFKLVDFTRVEFSIFRELESQAYGSQVRAGFSDIESFVSLANTVLNRRKSRAGKSLEHHLSSIFKANGLRFEEQVVTEGRKRPDFVFPSGEAYHDLAFPTDRIIVLAAKTTCKDRWRQILNEADRSKGGPHFLMTLQQGNTDRQLEEMRAENVQLVVPKQYINAYPPSFRDSIWPLKRFIEYAREKAVRKGEGRGLDGEWHGVRPSSYEWVKGDPTMPMTTTEADAVVSVAHELRGLAAMMGLASQSMDEAERHAMEYCCERVDAAYEALSAMAESALKANAEGRRDPLG